MGRCIAGETGTGTGTGIREWGNGKRETGPNPRPRSPIPDRRLALPIVAITVVARLSATADVDGQRTIETERQHGVARNAHLVAAHGSAGDRTEDRSDEAVVAGRSGDARRIGINRIPLTANGDAVQIERQ